jgi:hypothetical protein
MSTFETIRARSPLDEVWAVCMSYTTVRHAVRGWGAGITLCGEPFANLPHRFELLPSTCEDCLEALGCLPSKE